jgi:hypothetical protein
MYRFHFNFTCSLLSTIIFPECFQAVLYGDREPFWLLDATGEYLVFPSSNKAKCLDCIQVFKPTPRNNLSGNGYRCTFKLNPYTIVETLKGSA